jgi:dTDP-4-dehydrorhamnose reductase
MFFPISSGRRNGLIVTLIVGADGLIGGALLRLLCDAGEEVVGTSRRPGSGLVELDLREPDCFSVQPGIHTAVLCAGIGSLAECASAPLATAAVNVDGTVRLARSLADAGVNVVLLSTNLVFDGATAFPTPGDPVSPCCEYGRQKARMERELQGPRFAILRLTKVTESLGGRFRAWRGTLLGGGDIHASSVLRFSPVSLASVCSVLAALSRRFEPGVFQLSGERDVSYFEAALGWASFLGVPARQVRPDVDAATALLDPMPRHGTLALALPAACPARNFAAHGTTLIDFLRSL